MESLVYNAFPWNVSICCGTYTSYLLNLFIFTHWPPVCCIYKYTGCKLVIIVPAYVLLIDNQKAYCWQHSYTCFRQGIFGCQWFCPNSFTQNGRWWHFWVFIYTHSYAVLQGDKLSTRVIKSSIFDEFHDWNDEILRPYNPFGETYKYNDILW